MERKTWEGGSCVGCDTHHGHHGLANAYAGGLNLQGKFTQISITVLAPRFAYDLGYYVE
jgi:hypothetical protein